MTLCNFVDFVVRYILKDKETGLDRSFPLPPWFAVWRIACYIANLGYVGADSYQGENRNDQQYLYHQGSQRGAVGEKYKSEK